MPAPLIDWILAEWLAGRVAGDGYAPWPDLDLGTIVADARHRVIASTVLEPKAPMPEPEGVTRREWIAANLASTRALMDPLLERASTRLAPTKASAQLWVGFTGSAEVGLLIGYMAGRVLGQYELVLLPEQAGDRPPRLLFVLPNLGEAVQRFDADAWEFVTWVALHEVTHAVQFGGVPWLQEHLAGQVRELLERAEARMEARRHLHLPGREAVQRVGRAVRHADLIGMFASEPERAMIDRTQAVMAVIEGHAEHVMDAVAPELLPSLPQMRQALEARRKTQTPVGRVVGRLLGMEMKLRQYERGKIFCDAIVKVAGRDALTHLFSAPDALPSLVEIDDPAAWLTRVGLGAA